MGAAATASADYVVDIQAFVKGLGDDFFGAGYIAKRADRVGTAARDNVRFAAFLTDRIGEFFHRFHHVRTTGNDGDAGDSHQMEQKIVAGSLLAITTRNAFLNDKMTGQALFAGRSQCQPAVV